MLAPKIDKRTTEDLYKQLERMIPTYTPEWRFNRADPDPGTALFMIFADMFQETVDRLNKVPTKNYLAFLNMLNVELNSVVPAVGYAQFKTSRGATAKVHIPSGTKLYADNPDAGGSRVIFETRRSFYATPARIKSIYNVNPQKDAITQVYSSDGEPDENSTPTDRRIPLFNTDLSVNLQEHSFQVSEGILNNITHPCVITVKPLNTRNSQFLDNTIQKLANPELVQWFFPTEKGWKEFDRMEGKDGAILLYKDGNERMEPITGVPGDGEEVYISCRAKKIDGLKQIAADRILVGARWNDGVLTGIPPELLYANDIPLDAGIRHPFGDRFSQYDCFYIKSDEVFTKKGAEITLELDLDFVQKDFGIELPELDESLKLKYIMEKRLFKKPEKKSIIIERVLAEYWNGFGWVYLQNDSLNSEFFAGEKGKRILKFILPEDCSKVVVNSLEGYWIRFRIIDIQNNYSSNGVYHSPWLLSAVLKYDHKDQCRFVEKAICRNNGAQTPIIDMTGGVEIPLMLFEPLPVQRNSVYICFEGNPVGIPILFYFPVLTGTEARVSEQTWHIYSKSRGLEDWHPLRIYDRTDGFSKSGSIAVESNGDNASTDFFGVNGYWLKIECEDLNPERTPLVDGIFLNTVEIIQQESHKDERFTLDPNDMEHSIQLTYFPVIEEEVWVNEHGHIHEEDYQWRLIHCPEDIRDVYDTEGGLAERWIRWKRVDNFLESSKTDRHYSLDPYRGIITFGDDTSGRRVAEGDGENILVNYSTGGGTMGNLPEGGISNLLDSIAYIEGVRNIKQTCGGCDRQEIKDAAALGPAVLKNRGRAVTVQDFEKLILYHIGDVKKVKCISNMNQSGEIEYGAITIVAMCNDYRDRHYNIDLCSEVRRFLLDKSYVYTSHHGKIFVVPPSLLQVNVECDVIIEHMEKAGEIENRIKEEITSYLDPFIGADGRGWAIGQLPRPAHFYTSIKKIPGIKYIRRINLDGCIDWNGVLKYYALDRPVSIPFVVPVNGKHKVVLSTDG